MSNSPISSFITASAAVVAAACGAIALGYYSGRDTAESEVSYLEDKLSVYEAVEDSVGIMRSLDALKTMHEELFEFDKFAGEISDLKSTVGGFEAQNIELKRAVTSKDEQIEALAKELGEASTEVERLTRLIRDKSSISESFSVPENGAKTLLDGDITIGVSSNYGSWINATVQGSMINLDVGEFTFFGVRNVRCKLIYVGVGDSKINAAEFNLVCK